MTYESRPESQPKDDGLSKINPSLYCNRNTFVTFYVISLKDKQIDILG